MIATASITAVVTAPPDASHTPHFSAGQLKTGLEVRLASRAGTHAKSTAGIAPKHLQANLLVLPQRYASDFRNLCARNPVPCPLIAESAKTGDYSHLRSLLPNVSDSELAAFLDLRSDCPRYNVYHNSKLVRTSVPDVHAEWTSDHVAFLIGCSYSFETALAHADLPVRHVQMGRTVPMYRTNIPLNPSGVFTGGTYVVSMRPYRRSDIGKVQKITSRYLPTHGEPVAWGWGALARIGIQDIDCPQWGHAPLTEDGRPLGELFGDEENIPVFWGCGVTPQEAIMRADLDGTIMAHAPGEMLVLDCLDDAVLV